MTSEDKELGDSQDRLEDSKERLGAAAGRVRDKATDLTTGARTIVVKRMPRRPEKPIDLSAVQARERLGVAAARARDMATDLSAGTRTIVVKRMPRRREKPFDLSALPAEAKQLYCRILALQTKSDRLLDPREISNLYLFASTIRLDAESRTVLRREITAARADTKDGDGGADDALALTAQLSDLLDEPARAAVLTLLVKDLLWVARADAQVVDVERARVTAIAGLVSPDDPDEIVRQTERLLDAEAEFATGKITARQLERRTKDIAAAAAGLGAPLVAINSLAGASLSAAGLTHALAALGFGGVLGLSSMVTGIGTVVVMGVVVYQGTRFFLGLNERVKQRRWEFLVQQIIRNHQQAIADLTEDIAELARRMDEYLELTTRNEERLAILKADLSSFRLALADLQSREALARAPNTRP